MTAEQVELISIRTVEHAIDKFSGVVAEKLDVAIKLHEARNAKILDNRIEEHIKSCPVGTTIRLTTSRVVIGTMLFVALSGGSAEVTRKIVEFLVRTFS